MQNTTKNNQQNMSHYLWSTSLPVQGHQRRHFPPALAIWALLKLAGTAIGHLNSVWAVLPSPVCMTALASLGKCWVRGRYEQCNYFVPASLPGRCCQVRKHLSVTLASFYMVRGRRKGLFLWTLPCQHFLESWHLLHLRAWNMTYWSTFCNILHYLWSIRKI